jgi:hypothetical protein
MDPTLAARRAAYLEANQPIPREADEIPSPSLEVLEDRLNGVLWGTDEDWSPATWALVAALRPFAAALTRASTTSNEVDCLAEEAIDHLRAFLIDAVWMGAARFADTRGTEVPA